MKSLEIKFIEWFLRLSLSAGFLSASADRFGWWPKKISAWGNWQSFVNYTQTLLHFLPKNLTEISAYFATGLEVAFGVLLLTTFHTKWVARGSGLLLLIFVISMAISLNIKAPLDYSVLTASAAAFGLGWISDKEKSASNFKK